MQKQNNSTMRYHSLLSGKRAIIKKMKKISVAQDMADFNVYPFLEINYNCEYNNFHALSFVSPSSELSNLRVIMGMPHPTLQLVSDVRVFLWTMHSNFAVCLTSSR